MLLKRYMNEVKQLGELSCRFYKKGVSIKVKETVVVFYACWHGYYYAPTSMNRSILNLTAKF